MAKNNQQGEAQSVATLDRPEAGEGKPNPAPVIPQTPKGLEIPVQRFPRIVVKHDGQRFGGFVKEEQARAFIRSTGKKGATVEIEFVDANGYPINDPAEAFKRAKEEEAREKARIEYEKEQARIALENQPKDGSDGKVGITPRRVIQQMIDTLKDMPAKVRFMAPAIEPMRHEALPDVPMGQQEKITLEIIYQMDE